VNHASQSLVRCDKSGPVLSVWMDAPETGNAMSVAMTLQLAEAFEAAAEDSQIQVVVLRSTGRHFCTGGNVKDMKSGMDLMEGSVSDVLGRLGSTLHRLTLAIRALEVPVIASVNGMAVGAGCDISLMCDVRIASTKAQFAESFLRLGLVSGIGGAWFLNRLVGPAKAMEMTLTSEFIDAADALKHGIVSKVVAPESLAAETDALAMRIAAAPPLALRMAKKLVRESASADLSSALAMAGSIQAILLCGQEHKDVVTKFLDSSRAR
jgi:2-(1,2-epoxy-1,2-dihydrophenyl)acetyl-CoA isomerase